MRRLAVAGLAGAATVAVVSWAGCSVQPQLISATEGTTLCVPVNGDGEAYLGHEVFSNRTGSAVSAAAFVPDQVAGASVVGGYFVEGHAYAEDIHELLRAWELKHRMRTSESVLHHTMFRKETRWPGYYYRGDAMKLNDDEWHVLTVSRRDPKTGEYTMEKAPLYHLVGKDE